MSREDAQMTKDALEKMKAKGILRRHTMIQAAYASGQFGMTADEVSEFMAAFEEMSKHAKLRVGGEAPPAFRQMVEASGASEQDLMFLTLMLLQNKKDANDTYWGRRLLLTLSAAGFTESTIRFMSHALIQHKQQPGALRNAQVAVERGRLQKVARQGENSRAMVLEGKIAYELGDQDTALQLWWRAVDGAVAKSKIALARRSAGLEMGVDISAVDVSDLSTPWNELIEAHFERSLLRGKDEWEQCEKAIHIGMEQDDPTAFYYAATYYKKRNEDGTHKPTSEWLYYMTKAAASGVPKACYELGVFYAESGWKYIEDEPPEHVKPTPFDTYPGEHVSDTPWDRVRRFFSLSDLIKPSEPKDTDSVFHTAAWPPTPELRYELAIRWLNISAANTYAPAHLFLAKLYMQETLWAGAQAPREALEMSPKRYYYASKEDEADAHFTGDVKTHELPEDSIDPPNPDYDLELARFHLLEVFLARFAVVSRSHMLKEYAKDRRDIEFEDVEMNRNEITMPVLKYFDNAETYEQWSKESLSMYKEAAAICEEMNWSIYDRAGAQWYKAGLGMEHKDMTPGSKVPS